MDSPSNVKAGLKKSVFSAIKGTDRLLRQRNANAQLLQSQDRGNNDNEDSVTKLTDDFQQTTREQPKEMENDDERMAKDDGENEDGDRLGPPAEVLGAGDNTMRVSGERGTGGNRLRKRRSVSCEPTSNSPAKMAPHQPAADAQSAGCLQRTQSVTVVGVPSVQNVAAPIASSSGISSRMPSSLSICSFANSEVSARKRSPSRDGSLCSKEERSLSSTTPKINISICGKALYACASGRLDELKALLTEHPELVNYQYPLCYRYSCLHIAAKAGDFAIVRFLIKNGAKLNAKDQSWSTPLHLAAQAGHLEMTKHLRDMGADPTILDAHGRRYCDYLPTNNRKQNPRSANHKKFKTICAKNDNCEDTDSVSSSQSQLSLSFHQRFETFRKPIGRAVSDFLHRK